jgi:hypothetical protein
MTGRSLSLLVLTAACVAACGGAAPAKSPEASESMDRAAPEPRTPRTIEEAQDQIARARASLDGSKTKATEPSAPSAEKAPQGGAVREEKPVDLCGSPCRALASMTRAVEALCRMTGDADNRCVDARRTLDESTARVSSCRCEEHSPAPHRD